MAMVIQYFEPRQEDDTLQSQKELIHSFMTAPIVSNDLCITFNYSSCFQDRDINNAKAVVPWKELLTRSEEYVGVKYLPADLTLMDPSHIRADDVIRLLDHWYGPASPNETLALVSTGWSLPACCRFRSVSP